MKSRSVMALASISIDLMKKQQEQQQAYDHALSSMNSHESTGATNCFHLVNLGGDRQAVSAGDCVNDGLNDEMHDRLNDRTPVRTMDRSLTIARTEDATEIPIELRRNYVKRRLSDLTDVENALKLQDFDQLKKVGHKIRGNAASFAYLDLEQMAIALEDAADQRDSTKAGEIGRDFRRWLVHEMCRPWFVQRSAEI